MTGKWEKLVLTLKQKHMTVADTVSATMKESEGEKGEDGEEEGNTEYISYGVVLQYVDTLLQCIDQWGFEYNDITAMRKIQIAVRSLKQLLQTNITDYLLK
jgi:hypothetical protein